MDSQQVALLRGMNVGRAKRITTADLRKVIGDIGFTDVCTVVNSSNVVFRGTALAPAETATLIEEALVLKLGVAARATVLCAEQLSDIITDNCLQAIADDPSRLLVSVLGDPADIGRLRPLLKQDWAPEAFAAGRWAAYVWCPGGVPASRAAAAMAVLLGDAVTSRNWAIMHQLYAAIHGQPASQ
jgi:uncharacterized protein (DUF1697 family)